MREPWASGKSSSPPANSENLEGEIRDRLKPFLRLAFRSAVEKEVADRHVHYAQAQVKSEESFTAGMKKVVSAILSSPLFVFRHETVADNDPYALASKLSFSLWGSCPDEGLLNAAEKGSLTNPNELAKVVDGMLEDPKIERFLDSFPSQWMQLENALAATPGSQGQPVFFHRQGISGQSGHGGRTAFAFRCHFR